MGRVSQIVDCLINRVTAKKRFAVTQMVNKKAFQSNAKCPLVDSPCVIVNRFEHVGGGGGGQVQGHVREGPRYCK